MKKQIEKAKQAIENIVSAIAELKADGASAEVLRPYQDNLATERAKLVRLKSLR